MNTQRIAIFIDGAYFDNVMRDDCGGCRVDYQKLASRLAGGVDTLRTYYCNCLPYQSPTPSEEEKQRFAAAQRFHFALRALPRFEVREGMLVFRGRDETGKPIYVQKGVDLQLGIDLVLLAAKQQVSHAALVAGDSDLIPAVLVAKNEGVLIHLFHGASAHRRLIEVADERTLLTPEFMKDLLLHP